MNYKVKFSFEVDGGMKDSREVVFRAVEFSSIARRVKKYLAKEFAEITYSDPVIVRAEVFETEIA